MKCRRAGWLHVVLVFVATSCGQPLKKALLPPEAITPSGRRCDRPAVYSHENSEFHFARDNHSPYVPLLFGSPGMMPIAGDWNGDGFDTLGLYRPSTGYFFLTDQMIGGPASNAFQYGPTGMLPIAGDWNGDGIDTVGLYDSATGMFLLTNVNAPGIAEHTFSFGGPGMFPVAGDWDGDGKDTVGVYDPKTGAFWLTNATPASGPTIAFQFARPGTVALAGDWNGDGKDTVGTYDPQEGFQLAEENAGTARTETVLLGGTGYSPLAGHWPEIFGGLNREVAAP